jgi:hypothetical protein
MFRITAGSCKLHSLQTLRLAATADQRKNSTEGRMKFGLFDHVEHAGRPLATLFDERLAFVQAG